VGKNIFYLLFSTDCLKILNSLVICTQILIKFTELPLGAKPWEEKYEQNKFPEFLELISTGKTVVLRFPYIDIFIQCDKYCKEKHTHTKQGEPIKGGAS
jgi:hypothetical protein